MIYRAVCGVVLFGILAPECAYAYIDPGLGSLLLQGVAASAISVLVFWRGLRHKIAAFFTRKDSREKDDA